jgi:hypothetical protein
VVEYLWHHYEFCRISFADPLKRAAQEIFGLSDDQTWSRDQKEVDDPRWGMSPRRMFQLLGTEAMQPTFGREVWIKRWKISYDLVKESDHVVVPDVRFEPEAQYIRSLGGLILRVDRDVDNGLSDEAKAHVSEAGLLSVDHVIDNNKTLADLEAAVIAFAKSRGLS